MAKIEEYIESINQSLRAIEAFSFTDEAETREVLKKVDDMLDTLRSYLEGHN